MKKIILITSLVFVLGIVLWYIFLVIITPEIKPIYKKIEIKSDIDKSSIFLKQKVWGVTSDNNIITISKSSLDNFEINNDLDFVFNGYSTFFYRYNHDSLIVYVQNKVVPPSKNNIKFKIVQIELSNSEIMSLLENDSYKKRGLKLF